jgi:hypothetical protein
MRPIDTIPCFERSNPDNSRNSKLAHMIAVARSAPRTPTAAWKTLMEGQGRISILGLHFGLAERAAGGGGSRKDRQGWNHIDSASCSTGDQRGRARHRCPRHVHHPRHGPGIFAADIHGNRPGRPDGAFEKEHGSGQALDGDVSVRGQCSG